MHKFRLCGLAAIALAAFFAAKPATAGFIGTNVSYGQIHGTFSFTNASLNGHGAIISVSPGTPVSLFANYAVQDTDNSFCPGCIIQLYVGLTNPAGSQSAGFYSGGISSSFAGTVNTVFTAPSTPGIYDVGATTTLQFNYLPNVAVGGGTDIPTTTTPAFIAEIRVPEPATLSILGAALTGLAGLRRRRA